MPRVKAITTGSIPGFLDVILNFAESDTTSSLAQQDNWLAQIKANGGKLVMYGDDTWLKLFPGMFHRSDGTTSFFVSVSGLLLQEWDSAYEEWIVGFYRGR
jgi:predicted AlkP superfamily pyrophosphatase or phosphodiesterase